MFGIDYAWGRPGVAALKKAGVKFVCRYLSHDTSGKNLTMPESSILSDAGISIVVVWESGAQRALGGHAAGVADARAAKAQAEACGMPGGRPIYFAVDFDAVSPGSSQATRERQWSAISAYLDGAAQVLGRGRVGLYAGYHVIKRAFDARKITWGWQTYAWSGGHWDARAHLQQYSNDHKIGGVGVDYNRAIKTDYGQWRVGAGPAPTPHKEDDVDLSDKVNLTSGGKPLWSGQYIGKNEVSVGYALACAAMSPFYLKDRIIPLLNAQGAAIEVLTKTITQLAANKDDIDTGALIAQIQDAISKVVIHLDPGGEPAAEGETGGEPVGEPGSPS